MVDTVKSDSFLNYDTLVNQKQGDGVSIDIGQQMVMR